MPSLPEVAPESHAELEAEGQRLGLTPLMTAAAAGRLEDVRRMVLAGDMVNARTAAGATPLMYAARNDRAEVVRELLIAGADPRLQTHHGSTAESLAERFGASDVLAVLRTAPSPKPLPEGHEIGPESSAAAPELTASRSPSSRLTRRRWTIYAGLLVELLIVFYPPHLRPVGEGVYASVGFAPLLSPPHIRDDVFAIVNVPLLVVLLLVVAAFTATIWYLQRDDALHLPEVEQ